MTAKHTPGEWKVVVDNLQTHVELSDGTVIYVYDDSTDHSIEEIEANARLIAASPELLAGCEFAIAFLDQLELGLPDDDPLIELRKIAHKPLRDKLEPTIRKARRE